MVYRMFGILVFGCGLVLTQTAAAQEVYYAAADGNRAVRVTVRTPSAESAPSQITIPEGTIVESEDASLQGLVIGRRIDIQTAPGSTHEITVPTYCIDSSRGVPGNGTGMSQRNERDAALDRLVALTGTMPHDVIQSAVWAYRDGSVPYDPQVQKALDSARVFVKPRGEPDRVNPY